MHGFRLVARESGYCLALEIEVHLPAHVDCHAQNSAVGEGVRRFVLLAHFVCAVEADAKAVAAEREVPSLCPHWAFCDDRVVYVELRLAKRFAVLTGFLSIERDANRMLAGSKWWGDERLLRLDTEEVVHVVQLSILDEQCVAAETRAVREDHSARCGCDFDVGDDLVGPP